MDALITIGLALVLGAPLHLFILRLFDRLDSPAYLREVGAIILDTRALDSIGDVIGFFQGSPIYQSVTFKGMLYEFEETSCPDHKRNMGPDELYLDPGLLYVAHD